jgi:hypothetical protein
MNNQIKNIVLFCILLFCFSQIKAQNPTVKALEKILMSENLFVRAISKSYQDNKLQTVDTFEYVKQKDYEFYKSNTTKYIKEKDNVLFIDKELKSISFSQFPSNRDKMIQKLLALENSQNEGDEEIEPVLYNDSCQCLTKQIQWEEQTISTSFFFDKNLNLKKMVYQISTPKNSYRSEVEYQILCTTNCQKTIKTENIANYIIQEGKNIKLLPAYKKYRFSVSQY